MEVDEGTVKSLVRALARGDLESIERSAIAIASGKKFHAEYRNDDMWPQQRLLAAWRYALPPYHRNPTRKAFVEARTKEQRLVGCYVEIVPLGARDLDSSLLKGTITEDDGNSWLLSTQVSSTLDPSRKISVPMRVLLDNIAVCEIHINDVQLSMRQPLRERAGKNQDYLGLPSWEWFSPDQECGLAI